MLYEISGMKRGFAFALTLISNFNFNRYESGVSGISHNKPQEDDSNFFPNFWQFLQLFYVIYKGQTITERCLKVSRNTPLGCRDGAVVRALASHQCGPASIPRSGVICGLSLLVLYSAPRGFLRVLRFPLFSKTNI